MKFGFDLDEVVCDLTSSLLDMMENTFDVTHTIDIFAGYDFYYNDYCGDNNRNKEIADFLVDAVRDLGVLSGCKVDKRYARLAAFLHTKGYEIHFITARNDNAEGVTRDWLAKHRIPCDSLTVIGYGNEKGPVIKDLKLDYFVDDFIENIESALKHDKNLKGNTFIVDKPWNSDYINKDVIRARNDFDIIDHIIKREAGGAYD